MSIVKSRKLGRFMPPEDSKHAQRVKNVFKGEDSITGNPVHFYEKDGRRFKIDPLEFPKWRRKAGN